MMWLWWLLGAVCTVWVIYDVAVHKKRMSPERKLIWIVCAVLFSVLTAIVYYFVEKK